MSSRITTRKRKAQSLAEVSAAVAVMIIFMLIPMVDMVTFSLRYNFLLMASRDAAYVACRAKTFATNVSSSDLSAVNAATKAAQASAAQFPITVNSVNTSIIITKLSNGVVTRQSTPLKDPADTTNYAYQLETVLNGSTNPIISAQLGQYSSVAIPGLTAPIAVSIASRGYSENPQGLNQ